MVGGKRKGAGRPPVPDNLKKKTYSTKIRFDQIEWIKDHPHGWFAKWLETNIDKEIEKQGDSNMDKKVRKVVLDQDMNAWGYADVLENVTSIDLFSEMTIDGTPINVITRKVSIAKKHEKQIKETGGYEIFTEYQYKNFTYYKY